MIQLEEQNAVYPICPHCNAEIRRISMQQIDSFMGKRYVYFCPECRKVLGVTHRKGFWMG
ncbi:hypothetical protein GF373_04595 [bacterium]|nr:hypothetical protein [bacterium]